MKIKLRYTFILFVSLQFTYSQTKKIINGKVMFDNFMVSNVEVINSNSKILTVTDAEGNFAIETKVNDTLVFVTKTYTLKTVKISNYIYETGRLNLVLNLKPEELSEVTIVNKASLKLSNDKNWEQQKLDEYKLEKIPKGEQPVDFNSTQIPNGPDLMRIGGMIASLFTKEKEERKEKLPEVNFKTAAQSLVDHRYYVDILKLKEDEIQLFLQFCEADPKSYQVAQEQNSLSMMDFLNLKNEEFKKL